MENVVSIYLLHKGFNPMQNATVYEHRYFV